MRVFILALTLASCSTVAAQLFQGLFDYGGGLDLFMAPGYNEGPCIHRTRRRRRRRRRTTAKPAASVVLTPEAAPNNGFRPVVGEAKTHSTYNDPMLADPFYGGLDFMFGGGFFYPSISNPAPVKPPKAKPPKTPDTNSFRQKSKIAPANQQQNIGPKGLDRDYSKLTTTELRNLLKIAEGQARIDIKVENTKSAKSAPGAVNLANNAQAPKVSYRELSNHLNELQKLAQEQRNANADGTAQAISNRNMNAAASNFRSMGVLARKRRAMRHHISKRQMFPFDFMDMFRGTGMGTGSAVPAPLNMGFCQCMQRSEVENGFMIQSSSKYKCNRGLVCACHAGGLYRKKKK